MKLDAILWDYDGTLVNTVPKNISITKEILSIVAPHLTKENLPKCLQSEELYHIANHRAKNWQELYIDYYGLSHEEMLIAGSLWAEFQDKNKTKVVLFDGIKDVLIKSKDIPHGVCSQNSKGNIRRVFEINGVSEFFKAIVGYDDVPNHYQKPHPFGGVKCLKSIFGRAKNYSIMYIGDHESDTQFARNIQSELGVNVISVAAAYSLSEPKHWKVKPDYIAYTTKELLSIIDIHM